MTVGIAVVANRPRDAAETGRGANAVVLVADKQITQATGLKADVEVEKKLALMYGWELLFAGLPSTAHSIGWQLRQLRRPYWTKRERLADAVERIYQRWWDRKFERIVLRRNLLSKKVMTSEHPPTHLLGDYWRSRIEFEENHTCDFILAGFDTGRAALVVVKNGDAEIDQLGSYRVIGQGESAALPRLHELGAQASDGLDAALFHAISAKMAAEHVASVGPGTDAWIVRRGRRPHRVDQEAIEALRSVVTETSRSPFSKTGRKRALVRGWATKLRAYTDAVLRGQDPKWPTSSPTAPARPSSRSRTDGRR